jgi:hypothetical protein
VNHLTNALSCIAAALQFVVGGALADEPPTSLNPAPSVPDDYLTRWLSWKEGDDLRRKLYDEPAESDERSRGEETEIARARNELAVRTGEFAELDSFDPGNDDFSARQRAEVRRLFLKYLAHLRKLATSKNAPPTLAWHGLAATSKYQETWPAWCQQHSGRRGEREVAASLLWKADDTEWSYFGLRVAPNRLMLAHDDRFRVFDMRNGKWSGVPAEEAHHPQIEQVRFGITDDELLFLDRIYSYSTRKWVLAPFGESSPMYMSDPMKLGAEWMSFYQNPPHGHPYIEGKEASMTPEEIRKAWEPFRDRFDFRNMDGKLRSIPLESQVGTYFSTNSERLVAVDGVDRSARRSAYEESMRIAETPENLVLKEVMSGYFNGVWSSWNGAEDGDRLVLEQRMDYVTSVPVRAATWDRETKKWELLWKTESPQMPPPPPGMLEAVLAQEARWELPRDITHPPIGSLVHCGPVLSRKGTAFIFAETRDYLAGTHATDLWIFKPGARKPVRIAIQLPSYCPKHPLPADELDKPLQATLAEKAFVFSDHRHVWLLQWNFESGEPKAKTNRVGKSRTR